MVKKKVSKKKASSRSHISSHKSNHKTKKHIIHTKPAVEILDVAPVQQQTINPARNEALNFEQSTQRINVEPAPIFKDDTLQTEEPVKPAKVYSIFKILAIAVCCIVVIFWIALAILSIEINSGPKIITQNVSVTTYAFTNISLERFMNITDIKYSENVAQLGYLSEETTSNGFIKKYLVDDNGNRIELLLDAYAQDREYEKLFIMGNMTKQLYNVTGTFRFKMNGFVIEVENITKGYKDLKATSVWRMENLTTDDRKGITFDVARGVNKIVTFV